jgi:hypothetical protein
MVQVGQDNGRQWDTVQVGQTWFFRSYVRPELEVSDTINTHFIHVGENAGSGSDYAFWWFFNGTIASDSTGAGPYALVTPNTAIDYGRGEGRFDIKPTPANEFKQHQTYIFEMKVERFQLDSARWNVRISDSIGGVLLTSGDFMCSIGPANGCALGGTLPSIPVDTVGQYAIVWDSILTERLTALEIGNNGSDSSDPTTERFIHIGGQAIRISDDTNAWIGAYPVAGEGN